MHQNEEEIETKENAEYREGCELHRSIRFSLAEIQ
jgi:hypothetical protein